MWYTSYKKPPLEIIVIFRRGKICRRPHIEGYAHFPVKKKKINRSSQTGQKPTSRGWPSLANKRRLLLRRGMMGLDGHRNPDVVGGLASITTVRRMGDEVVVVDHVVGNVEGRMGAGQPAPGVGKGCWAASNKLVKICSFQFLGWLKPVIETYQTFIAETLRNNNLCAFFLGGSGCGCVCMYVFMCVCVCALELLFLSNNLLSFLSGTTLVGDPGKKKKQKNPVLLVLGGSLPGGGLVMRPKCGRRKFHLCTINYPPLQGMSGRGWKGI